MTRRLLRKRFCGISDGVQRPMAYRALNRRHIHELRNSSQQDARGLCANTNGRCKDLIESQSQGRCARPSDRGRDCSRRLHPGTRS